MAQHLISTRNWFAVWLMMSSLLAGAEPELPGLELWLDAAAAQPAPVHDQRLSNWTDLSKSHMSAAQPAADKQPRLVKIGNSWVVRFDGEDDHLRILGLHKALSSFTLFVVAAPHSNLGFFRGLFAFNQVARRDYETGFTLDLNAPFSSRLDNLNLEGKGFGGARNLLKDPSPFGSLRILECVADPQARKVRLIVDGKPQLDRDFDPSSAMVMDEITVGARFYTNEPDQAQQVRGFFQGDLAEILLYNRVLSAAEADSVRSYLDRKHAVLREELPKALNLGGGKSSEPLVIVADPPAVQMLAPGFSVHQLPVELTNTNNIRYRADGKLYALGYNGDVWLLRDADGDGLEETAHRFFENKGRLRGPIGMAVIPQGHSLLKSDTGQATGIVVPSKGKVSAILDHDGDDIADEERIIASGWKEITQNVDAIGAEIGPDGSIYFGLGTAQYDNAYLIDKDGKAHYDIKSDHGTIQRILPDLTRRETICTGVRFTIGMAMNRVTSGDVTQSDLFVTDQEGATWLPDGNPFDELLHIQAGRHYGFPPRHPRHLPDVADRPSDFDYAPQHQSTCGMAINQPRIFSLRDPQWQRQDALFGPATWRGNAFVTGESRGKLYRTELARDASGAYVARNQLIACLSMLTVDCCLSPQGDLIVACHSGGPDWGSGPNGPGKLFKIRYSQRELPQPVAIWAAGPREVHVAFDRPLDSTQLKDLATQTNITYGAFVAAGDRFETIWPGYAVVQMQKNAPRHRLPIQGFSVTPDRRTLVLATEAHPGVAHYALTLPGLGRQEVSKQADREPTLSKAIPQHSQVDLEYTLNGVAATWIPHDPSLAPWIGWLPHFDLQVSRRLSEGVSEIDRLWEVLSLPGQLTLEASVSLNDLVHPAVQPGARRDHQWPPESIQFKVACDAEFSLEADETRQSSMGASLPATLVHRVSSESAEPVKVRVQIKTGDRPSNLTVHWRGQSLDTDLPIPLNRLILPWAKMKVVQPDSQVRQPIPELAGGSWGRGRRVFFSEEAGCHKCHLTQPGGGRIGPDLGNLVHRDYQSVLRDITVPSFSLNPDFLTSILSLKDGRVLTGTLRSEGKSLLVGDKDGKVHQVPLDEIEEQQHSTVSIMPEGIPKKLGAERMNDLLTYLLTPPPQMPLESPIPPPKPRTRLEVANVLSPWDADSPRVSATPGNSVPLFRILLVAGAKDHGPGEHDYPAWLASWTELLRGAEGVNVDTAMEWPTSDQIENADTIIFFQKGRWDRDRAQAIDGHLAKGRGLVYIHWAVEAGAEAPAFAQRIGLASNAAKLKFRHGPLDLGFQTGADHPIGRNFSSVHFHDESYWQMQGDPNRIKVLASGLEEGQPQPLFWTLEPQNGRVFVSIPGHFSWTFDDPLFRILLLRGMCWTAKQPIDRLNELVTIGVKLDN